MSNKTQKKKKIPEDESKDTSKKQPMDQNEEPTKESDSASDNDNNEVIEGLKKELEAQKDRLLRTAAEYDNFRKRTEKEKALIYSDATSVAVSAILPIADSLEHATKSLEGTDENYQKGLLLIVNQFNESLKKLKVESFGEKGDSFNPDLHNAVSHIEDEQLGENVVSEVFQKGYKIGDHIVRYAMVQVAN